MANFRKKTTILNEHPVAPQRMMYDVLLSLIVNGSVTSLYDTGRLVGPKNALPCFLQTRTSLRCVWALVHFLLLSATQINNPKRQIFTRQKETFFFDDFGNYPYPLLLCSSVIARERERIYVCILHD